MKLIKLLPFLLAINMYGQSDTLEPITIMGLETNYPVPIFVVTDKIQAYEEPSKLLSTAPSIMSYSETGNYSGYAYLRMRGIDQTRINFTLDGVPLNESEDQGAYLSNFSRFYSTVDATTINNGVGISDNTASYAGSINFKTEPLLGDGYTRITANGGSFNSYGLAFQHKIKDETSSLSVGMTFQGSEGYRDRTNNRGSSFNITAGKVFNKFAIKFTNITGTQSNTLSWLGSLESDIMSNRSHNQNQDEEDNFLQSLSILSISKAYSDVDITIQGYYNYLDGNYDFDLGNFLYADNVNEKYNYALQHDMVGVIGKIQYDKNDLQITNSYHVNTFSRGHTGTTGAGGFLYFNEGVKDEFNSSLRVSYRNLFASSQYRTTSFRYTGDETFEKLTWNFLNYKAGFTLSDFYYSFGSVGREPSRTDLFLGEDNPSEIRLVPSERAYNHELGYRKGPISANLYHMSFDNELILNGQFGPNSLPIKSSVAESYRYGVELSAQHSTKYLDFLVNSSLSRNKVEQEGTLFTHDLSPNYTLFLQTVYHQGPLQLGAAYQGRSKIKIDLENKYEIPTMHDVSLSAEYDFGGDMSIRGVVNNVLNADYYQHGQLNVNGDPTYFVNAPTNFNITIQWNL